MCNVYRRFVKDFAWIAKQLTVLTSSTLPKVLQPPSPSEEEAVESLKRALLSPPVLALPHRRGTFVIDVDACDTQVGCTLLQGETLIGTDNVIPDLRPVGYFSRTLNPAERNYSATERECLGVIWAVQLLRPYLEGSRFIVRSDHEPLRWLLNLGDKDSDSHGRLARWRLKMAEHDYRTVSKAGSTHHLGDALSRLDTPSGDTRQVDEDIPVVPVCMVGNATQGMFDHTMAHLACPLTLADFREAQANDDDCRRHRANLLAGAAGIFSENEDGLIYRRAPADGRHQVVVPVSLRQAVMEREHENPTAGHPGGPRMFAAMRRFFYWPAMAVDVVDHVRGCHPCARNRMSLHRQASAMKLFPPDGPNEQVAIDILGPLPVTEEGNRYILVMSDRFTKLSRAAAIPDDTAYTIMNAVVDHSISAHGVMKQLLSDNGANLSSAFCTKVLGMFGIEPRRASDYHPQSNGQVERFNRTIVKMLQCYVAEHTNTWDRLLSVLTLAYNARPHRSTNIAPLEWVMPLGVGNLTLPPGRCTRYDTPKGRPAERIHLAWLAKLSWMIPKLKGALDRTQLRYKKNFDARLRVRNTTLVTGDWVYIRHQKFRGNKLMQPVKGPYRILHRDDHSVILHSDTEIQRININDVTPAPKPEQPQPVPAGLLHEALTTHRSDDPVGPDGIPYQVESVVGHTDPDLPGPWYVKVMWVGYDSPTWEQAANIPRQLLMPYMRRRRLL